MYKSCVYLKTNNIYIYIHEPCFFLLYPGYILFFCLRFAYVLPTPLQCPPTPGSCVLICLRAPTLTAKFLTLPTRPAFGASVGSAFCLVFSCFAYAGLGRCGHLVPIRVVLSFLSFQFHSFHFLPPTQPTQIESQPTSFKCLRMPPHTT